MTEKFELHVQSLARRFPYPPTPSIRMPERQPYRPRPVLRTVAIMVLLLVSLAGVLFAIPPIRAAVLEILHIGAIEITISDAPIPDNALPLNLRDLVGKVTLEEARQMVSFPLLMPPSFGDPDRVYVQSDNNGHVVIMVWLDHQNPEHTVLALYEFDPNTYAFKEISGDSVVEQPLVNGYPSVWTTAPHTLTFERDSEQVNEPTVLVEGHVLIWVHDLITYRMETDLDMADAVTLAESLR